LSDNPAEGLDGQTFDLYGHMFEDTEADREEMKKLEFAVRVVA